MPIACPEMVTMWKDTKMSFNDRNLINEEAIAKLSAEDLKKLLAMLTKAGY
jgi:hypothetical protein